MSSFLDNYESVNDSVIRFRAAHPNGRITPTFDESTIPSGYVVVMTTVEVLGRDQLGDGQYVLVATDYAYGNVAFMKENMKRWVVEDTVTSSIGRAIKLFMPSPGGRASREDMSKVESPAPEKDYWVTPFTGQGETPADTKPIAEVIAMVREQLSPTHPAQPPVCRHGNMVFKKGKSKTTGNDYKGYTCSSTDRADQCTAVWL